MPKPERKKQSSRSRSKGKNMENNYEKSNSLKPINIKKITMVEVKGSPRERRGTKVDIAEEYDL